MKNNYIYVLYLFERVVIGYECVSAVNQSGGQLNSVRNLQLVGGSQSGRLHRNIVIHVSQKQIVGVMENFAVFLDQVIIFFFQWFDRSELL